MQMTFLNISMTFQPFIDGLAVLQNSVQNKAELSYKTKEEQY